MTTTFPYKQFAKSILLVRELIGAEEGESGDNPEYVRGQVEFICYFLDININDNVDLIIDMVSNPFFFEENETLTEAKIQKLQNMWQANLPDLTPSESRVLAFTDAEVADNDDLIVTIQNS